MYFTLNYGAHYGLYSIFLHFLFLAILSTFLNKKNCKKIIKNYFNIGYVVFYYTLCPENEISTAKSFVQRF
jgi:hypothetical protein